MIDNVWYVLSLDAPRRFGWSRGPDTPDTGARNDWPPVSGGLHTFHWLLQDQSVAPNTLENLAINIAVGTGTWRHLKFRTTETTGTWFITDNVRLVALLRAAALTFGGATRRALQDWASFVEVSPLIPRLGAPS